MAAPGFNVTPTVRYRRRTGESAQGETQQERDARLAREAAAAREYDASKTKYQTGVAASEAEKARKAASESQRARLRAGLQGQAISGLAANKQQIPSSLLDLGGDGEAESVTPEQRRLQNEETRARRMNLLASRNRAREAAMAKTRPPGEKSMSYRLTPESPLVTLKGDDMDVWQPGSAVSKEALQDYANTRTEAARRNAAMDTGLNVARQTEARDAEAAAASSRPTPTNPVGSLSDTGMQASVDNPLVSPKENLRMEREAGTAGQPEPVKGLDAFRGIMTGRTRPNGQPDRMGQAVQTLNNTPTAKLPALDQAESGRIAEDVRRRRVLGTGEERPDGAMGGQQIAATVSGAAAPAALTPEPMAPQGVQGQEWYQRRRAVHARLVQQESAKLRQQMDTANAAGNVEEVYRLRDTLDKLRANPYSVVPQSAADQAMQAEMPPAEQTAYQQNKGEVTGQGTGAPAYVNVEGLPGPVGVPSASPETARYMALRRRAQELQNAGAPIEDIQKLVRGEGGTLPPTSYTLGPTWSTVTPPEQLAAQATPGQGQYINPPIPLSAQDRLLEAQAKSAETARVIAERNAGLSANGQQIPLSPVTLKTIQDVPNLTAEDFRNTWGILGRPFGEAEAQGNAKLDDLQNRVRDALSGEPGQSRAAANELLSRPQIQRLPLLAEQFEKGSGEVPSVQYSQESRLTVARRLREIFQMVKQAASAPAGA
jgi:hypothetical protein